ncbi:MAG: hypothetical protein HQ594_00870 [Candidatus Omnitrophica bacterium]|nr:hypothetical protein [Candidatus Omnitrophota bacterium]
MKKLISFLLDCVCFCVYFSVVPAVIPIIALIIWSQDERNNGYSNIDESYFDILRQCYREFGWL